MRKIGLALAMLVLLAGVSVQAQKKSLQLQIKPPLGDPTEIIIQDDAGAGYFVFNLESGEFTCNLCEYAYEFKGKGDVKIDGCNVSFSSLEGEYRIFGFVNMCTQEAKCSIEVFKIPDLGYDIEPLLETWSDNNIRDNTGKCTFEKY